MVVGLDLGGSGGPAWRAISKAVTRDSPMWRTTARPGGHGLQIRFPSSPPGVRLSS